MTSRRSFIAASLVLASLASHGAAPPGKTVTLGMLFPNSESASDPGGFIRAALQQRGYVEGKNLRIESRSASAQFDRLPALAAELAAAKPDVLIVVSTNATQAASKVAPTVPIVAVNIADPVKAGLAKSLGRPGGNITGLSNTLLTDANAKRLKLLLEIAPKVKRVAWLINADNVGNTVSAKDRQSALKASKLEGVDFLIRRADEVPAQLEAIARAKVDAIVVSTDPVLQSSMKRIAQFAVAKKLPSMSAMAGYTSVGGLAAYTHSLREQWNIVADQVDKILNGAKPAEMPFIQPTKLDLSYNRATAKALGITIPENLLLQADFVVD